MWRVLLFFVLVVNQGSLAVKVLITADTSIIVLDTKTERVCVLMNTTNPVYSLDLHYAKGLLYYVEDGTIRRTLIPSGGEKVETLVKYVPGFIVSNIAVDWVHDSIYWIIGLKAQVFVAGLDGNNAKLIINEENISSLVPFDNVTYLAILVDPFNNTIVVQIEVKAKSFQGKAILSSNLNGTGLEINMTNTLKSTSAMAMDIIAKRLYFTELKNDVAYLHSSDYRGNNLRTSTIQDMKLMFSIQVFGENVYYIFHDTRNSSGTPTLRIMDLAAGTHTNSSYFYDVPILFNFKHNFDMRMYDAEAQVPRVFAKDHRCERMSCSNKCVVLPTSGATCVCPPGQETTPDGKHCRNDQDLLLLVGNYDGISFLNLRNLSYSSMSRQEGSIIIDYHYTLGYIFFFSNTEYTIYRRSLATSGLNHPLMKHIMVSALAVDWVHGVLYCIRNTSESVWYPVKRSVMEMYNLDGSEGKTLLQINNYAMVYNMQLDPYEGLMFFINETGNETSINRSNLAGGGLVRNENSTIYNIVSLTLDIYSKRIYFTGTYRSNTYVVSTSYKFTDMTIFNMNLRVSPFYSLAVYKNCLYLYSAKNTTIYKAKIDEPGELLKLTKLKINMEILPYIRMSNMRVYGPTVQMSAEDQRCLGLRCTHVCQVSSGNPGEQKRVACTTPDSLLGKLETDICPGREEPVTPEPSSPSYSILLTIVLPVVVVIVVLCTCCCLWKRHGIQIGRHRWEYHREWWKRTRRE